MAKQKFSFSSLSSIKLTFLDYLILTIVLLGGILLYMFFNPKEEWITVEVFDQNIPIFQVQSLQKKDVEKDASGKVIAQVEDITTQDTTIPQSPNKDIFLRVKLLAKLNQRNKEYEFKSKIVKIGAPVELRFSSGLVTGTITGTENLMVRENVVEKIITIQQYNVLPWVSDNLTVGDSTINEKGYKITELVSKDVQPAEITTTTDTGQLLLERSPQRVDVTLKVKIRLREYNKRFIFLSNREISVGESITLRIGNTTIQNASIINIE